MTCFMEIPAFSRSDIVLSAAAPPTFSVRRKTPRIAEGVQSSRPYGVHRVRAYQLFNVEHIVVFWIFGAGAGPEQPLALSATRSQSFPARALNHLLVAPVGLLGIGDGNFAAHRLEASRIRRPWQFSCARRYWSPPKYQCCWTKKLATLAIPLISLPAFKAASRPLR